MKREIEYDNKVYKVKSDSVEMPDLDSMDRLGALVWLNQNTYKRGNGTRTKPNPLRGYGGSVVAK